MVVEIAFSAYSDESQCSSGDGSLIARSSSTEAYKKEELVVGDEVYEVVEDVSSLVNSNNSEVLAIHEDLYQDTEVGDSKSSYPLDLYVGLWDCIAIAKDELNFKRGDVIKIISKEYDDYQWWIGELNGKSGLVPKNYMMEAYEIANECSF